MHAFYLSNIILENIYQKRLNSWWESGVSKIYFVKYIFETIDR